MPSLEDALSATLLGINRDFERADRDLHEEVNLASQVLQRLSNGLASLELVKVEESERGMVYMLRLLGEGYGEEIGAFRVPARGYPLIAAGSRGSIANQSPNLDDRAALSAYFAGMGSNPDSPLVVKAAYLMRRKPPEVQRIGVPVPRT